MDILVVGTIGWICIWAQSLWPGLVDVAMEKLLRLEKTNDPKEPYDNLFAPHPNLGKRRRSNNRSIERKRDNIFKG